MKKIFIFFLIAPALTWSQKNDIEVFYKSKADTLIVKAINQSNKKIDVKFDITGSNFLSKTGRVQMIIEKSNNDTIIVAKLVAINKNRPVIVSKGNYSYVEIQTEIPKKIQNQMVSIDKVKPNQSQTQPLDNQTKSKSESIPSKKQNSSAEPIVLKMSEYKLMVAEQKAKSDEYLSSNIPIVFIKNGCPRCARSEKTITEKKMNVRLINITTSQKDNQAMFYMIEQQYGKNVGQVTMPVILKSKKLTHSHKNLEEIIEKL